jgi:hypothetical protein
MGVDIAGGHCMKSPDMQVARRGKRGFPAFSPLPSRSCGCAALTFAFGLTYLAFPARRAGKVCGSEKEEGG